MTNHIVSMKDEKKFNKKFNALIKWWIRLDLLQLWCRWIENLVAYSCGNESYCFNRKKNTIVIIINDWRTICRSI
jgi:hypothetical protein